MEEIAPPNINNERNKRHKHNDPILHDILTNYRYSVALLNFTHLELMLGQNHLKRPNILGVEKSPIVSLGYNIGEGISLLLPFWGK